MTVVPPANLGMLPLARINEVFPLFCVKCGGKIRIIAFTNQAMAVCVILVDLEESASAPRRAPADGPPLSQMPDAAPTEHDPQARPAPDYEFDQRIVW